MNPFRGLFGSSAKNYVNARSNDVRVNAAPGSAADREFGDGAVLRRVPTLTPDLETPKQERAQKWQVVGATLSDVGAALRGAQGGSLDRVQQGWRKRAAEEAAAKQMESLSALASQLYADDLEAQLLFKADPEAFVAARAERLKPRTMTGGQTYRDEMTGETYTAPLYDKFDDRYGGMDPNTGRTWFGEARGPTFQESTGRMNSEESARHNLVAEELQRRGVDISAGHLGVARGQLGLARTKDGREAAGGGAAGLGGMSTEQLLEALRR